ncbi:hypothetical protein [Lacihabitans soyangensis]|uniref:DUF3592 domain-containing protein n=1 Tax=Lacihabitans soyangensis TaxID=869394 RepID=A0AAE3GZ99_9BACT|nr:hypothetical protein [Lacihabitans soyangensis]MCP9761802.1 hypothetical protein [Lacihabitans soyangensis]
MKLNISEEFISRNRGTVIYLILLLTGFLMTKWNQKKHYNNTIDSPVFVTGYTLAFEKAGYRQSDYFRFQYKYKGTLYEKSDLSNVYINDYNKFFNGKPFPVILNPKFPDNGEMLFFRTDFEKYGYRQPDSLLWVNNYKK